MAVALDQEIPNEVINYLELQPLNTYIVKLLLSLTFFTTYSLSDVRIRQLVDVLFDYEQVDDNVFMVLCNNIKN